MLIFLKIVCTLALLIVSATMLVRANDLRLRPGLHWNVRLAGFILSGGAPVGIIGYGWTNYWMVALIYLTIFLVGIAAVFVTTPYLPPWWRWLSGMEPDEKMVYSDDRRKPQT